MGFFELANHLLNFLAPAVVLGLLTALAARFLVRKSARGPGFWVQAGCNVLVAALVLLAGLLIFGRDGKMATYLALVLACASSQWLMGRGWKS